MGDLGNDVVTRAKFTGVRVNSCHRTGGYTVQVDTLRFINVATVSVFAADTRTEEEVTVYCKRGVLQETRRYKETHLPSTSEGAKALTVTAGTAKIGVRHRISMVSLTVFLARHLDDGEGAIGKTLSRAFQK